MSTFAELIQQVRDGDETAIRELAQAYGPEIHRIARARLQSCHLRRLYDSCDICQSVLWRFFTGMTAGLFDLASPEDLLRLLVTMTANKVRDLTRRHLTQRRGGTVALTTDAEASAAVPDPRPGPEEIVALSDAREAIRKRLSPEERFVVEQRDEGRDWEEIGNVLGQSPEALRERLTRALDRAARELQLL
jgi:RNA polymerase sigma-70 factor (ECF subfamily)